MHYHSYNYTPSRSYNRNRELRAERRNTKHDGKWRKALKKLDKLNSLDFESLVHAMSAYTPKNLSKEQKIILATIAVGLFTAGLAYHLSKPKIDNYKPQISNLKYNPDISPGVIQNINFTATDANAKNTIIPENIAKTIVEVTNPAGHSMNETVRRLENDLFSVKFKSTTQEGQYKLRSIVEDKAGNVAVESGSFTVRDKPPTIKTYGVTPAQAEKGDNFNLHLTGKDDVGLKRAYAMVDFPNGSSREIPLRFNGTHYVAKLPAEQKGAHDFRLTLEDTKGQITTRGPITATVKYTFVDEYVDWAEDYGVDPNIAAAVYGSFRNLVEQLYRQNRNNLLEFLTLANENATLPFDRNAANIMAKIVYNDHRVPDDLKTDLIVSTSELLNDLGITGFNKIQGFWAGGNYTYALQRYPRHLDEDITRLLNATETNPEIIDFSPVILKSADGKVFSLTSNIPRETWMLVEHLKRTPYVAKYPEMFEALNNKIKQEAWCIFDDEDGPRYYDKRTYRPTDSELWDGVFIPHWDYYWKSTPQEGNSSGRITLFPWYNSSLAKQYIADKTNRTFAELLFWDLPARTFDKTTGKIINGIEGTKLFIQQLPREYEKIYEAYINPPSYSKIYEDPRWWWGQWFRDRSNHGLLNTVEQFKKIDDVLTDSWNLWNLIKFIYSYERHLGDDYGGSSSMHTFGLPLGYKPFGIPRSGIGVEPYIEGISYTEWSVSLPENVKKITEKNLLDDKIEIGYGNMISMYSCINGLEKDGFKKIYQYIRNLWPIYIWLKD